MKIKCPTCGYVEEYARSFVDPRTDDPDYQRSNRERYLFAAPGTGIIGQYDVVYCSGCNFRRNINWSEFSKPVEVYHCQQCGERYLLVMSERGRNFRGFRFE